MVELTEATLLQAWVDPKTKKSVDEHNLNAQKEAAKLLPKFEKLLVVIHDVVKKASIKRLLWEERTKETIDAINNSKPWDSEAEWWVFLERWVKLSIQEKYFDSPIENYIRKNLPENIDLNIFMNNTAFTAINDVMNTIQKLKDTVEWTTSIVTDTKSKADIALVA